MTSALITVLVIVLCVAMIAWCIQLLPLPSPFREIIIVILVVILILALLSYVGVGPLRI